MVKNLPANAGHLGLIPGSGGSPGEGNGNPFQYSCLENSMDRGAWQTVVHGFAKELGMTEALSTAISSVQSNRSVVSLCTHGVHIVNPNLPISLPRLPLLVLLYISGSVLSAFVGW